MSIKLPVDVGPYTLEGEIASGGMATVYFGRKRGLNSEPVAIKCMHPHCAADPNFVAMFMDEANLTSRIKHPNVVPVFDRVASGEDLMIVMEFVAGDTVSRLMGSAVKSGNRPNYRVVASIIVDVLDGLHAAHEAVGHDGKPLNIVHRDISPQNVMVGLDGAARVLDFGVAKAVGRFQTTRAGQFKGRLQYMAPEHIRARPVDRRADIYAVSVLMWEMLAGRQLFGGDNIGSTMAKVLEGMVPSLRALAPNVPAAVEAIVLRGLRADPADRFQTAHEMANAVRQAVGLLSVPMVMQWVQQVIPPKTLQLIEQIRSLKPGVRAPNFALQRASSPFNPPSSGSFPGTAPAPMRIDESSYSKSLPLPGSAQTSQPGLPHAGVPQPGSPTVGPSPSAVGQPMMPNPALQRFSGPMAGAPYPPSALPIGLQPSELPKKKRSRRGVMALAYLLSIWLVIGAFWFALHRVPGLGQTLISWSRSLFGDTITFKIEASAIAIDATVRGWLGLTDAMPVQRSFVLEPDGGAPITIVEPMEYPKHVKPLIIAPFARLDGNWIPAHQVPDGTSPYMYKTALHVDSNVEQRVVYLLLLDAPRCDFHLDTPNVSKRPSQPVAVVEIPPVPATPPYVPAHLQALPCTVALAAAAEPAGDNSTGTSATANNSVGNLLVKSSLDKNVKPFWSVPSIACLLQLGTQSSPLDPTLKKRVLAIGTRSSAKGVVLAVGNEVNQSGLARAMRHVGVTDAAQLGGAVVNANVMLYDVTPSPTGHDSDEKANKNTASGTATPLAPRIDPPNTPGPNAKTQPVAYTLFVLPKPLKSTSR